jgi:hypothetical protein
MLSTSQHAARPESKLADTVFSPDSGSKTIFQDRIHGKQQIVRRTIGHTCANGAFKGIFRSYVRYNAVKRPWPCYGGWGWVWKGHWFSSRIGACRRRTNGYISEEQLHGLFDGDRGLANLLEAVLNQVLEGQATEQLRAEPYQRTEERTGYRNGSRERPLVTRVGSITLEISQFRKGKLDTDLFGRIPV